MARALRYFFAGSCLTAASFALVRGGWRRQLVRPPVPRPWPAPPSPALPRGAAAAPSRLGLRGRRSRGRGHLGRLRLRRLLRGRLRCRLRPAGHRDVALELVERGIADAVDLLQVVHRLERPVGLAVIDDGLGLHRTDARQDVEFVLRRGIDVDGSDREAREHEQREREQQTFHEWISPFVVVGARRAGGATAQRPRTRHGYYGLTPARARRRSREPAHQATTRMPAPPTCGPRRPRLPCRHCRAAAAAARVSALPPAPPAAATLGGTGPTVISLRSFSSRLAPMPFTFFEIVDGLERPVRLAVVEDRLRLGRTDAGQRDEFVEIGGVDVDRRRQRRRPRRSA